VGLSTPNLDWVYSTHYRMGPTVTADETLRDCLWLNRAFHGWGHQFLYTQTMLEAALKSCGYASVRFQQYGQSDVPELSGIEKHETWQDTAEMPHVLIAEASGQAAEEPLPAALLEEFRVAVNTR
jgi:hypothetical protein